MYILPFMQSVEDAQALALGSVLFLLNEGSLIHARAG